MQKLKKCAVYVNNKSDHPLTITKHIHLCLRGVMAKALESGIVVREFELQSRYYVHFRTNTLRKGVNPLNFPSMS